jgi:hypothetical protein
MKPTGQVRIVTNILSVSLLLLGLFPTSLAASALTVAWDSNPEADLAGYKIYYGTRSSDYGFVADAGDVTQYTITGLAPETQYYLALTAYDFLGNESDFSAEVSAVTDVGGAPIPISIGGGGGGCFIAQAAYGSYLNPHVKILREFRDELLSSSSLGRKLVQLYHKLGPRIANHIEKNGFSRFLTRQALLPLIGISSLSLKTAVSPALLLLLLCPLFLLATLLRSYCRRTQ